MDKRKRKIKRYKLNDKGVKNLELFISLLFSLASLGYMIAIIWIYYAEKIVG